MLKPPFEPTDPGPRAYPIYLGRVGRMIRRVEIACANEAPAGGWDRVIECDAIRFRNAMRREGKSLLLEQEIETRQLSMPAEDAETYRAIMAELDRTDVVISETVNHKGHFPGTPEAARDARAQGLMFAAILLGLAGVGYAVYRYFVSTGAIVP